jgi:prevent-host-death family protein
MEHALMLEEIERTRSTELKTQGWATMVRRVRANKAVLIMNRSHPEVVIVDVDEYRELVEKANRAEAVQHGDDVLVRLSAQFDRFVADLNASDKLATAMRSPPAPGQKLKIGPSL